MAGENEADNGNDDLQHLAQLLSETENEVVNLHEQLTEKTKQILELQQQCEQLKEELRINGNISAGFRSIRCSLLEKTQEHDALSTRYQKLQTEYTDAKLKFDNQMESIQSSMLFEKQASESRYGEAMTKLQLVQVQEQESQTKLEVQDGQIRELQAQLATRCEDNAEQMLHAEINLLVEERQHLVEKISELELSVESTLKKVEEEKMKQNILQQASDQVRKQYDDLMQSTQQSIDAYKQERQEFSKLVESQKGELSSTQEELGQLKIEFDQRAVLQSHLLQQNESAAASEIGRLQAELENLKKENVSLHEAVHESSQNEESRVQLATETIRDLEQKLEQLRRDAKETRSGDLEIAERRHEHELEQLRVLAAQRQIHLSEKSQLCESLQSELTDLSSKHSAVVEVYNRLSEQQEKQSKCVSALQASNAEMKTEREYLSNQLQEAMEQFRSVNADNSITKETLLQVESNHSALIEAHERLKVYLESICAENLELKQNLERSQEQVETLRNEQRNADEYVSMITLYEQNIEQLREKNGYDVNELNRSVQQVKVLQERLTELSRKEGDLKADNDEQKIQMVVLETQVTEIAAERDDLEVQLKSSRAELRQAAQDHQLLTHQIVQQEQEMLKLAHSAHQLSRLREQLMNTLYIEREYQAQLVNELNAASDRARSDHNAQSALRADLDNSRRTREQVQNLLEVVKKEYDQALHRAQVADQKLLEQSQELKARENELEVALSHLEEASMIVKNLREENQMIGILRTELNEAQLLSNSLREKLSEKENTEALLHTKEGRIAQLEREAKDFEYKMIGEEKVKEELTRELQGNADVIENQKREIVELSSIKLKLDEELSSVKEELLEMNGVREKEAQASRAHSEKLQSAIDAVNSDLNTSCAVYGKLEQDSASLSEKLSSAESKTAALQGELEAVRAEISAAIAVKEASEARAESYKLEIEELGGLNDRVKELSQTLEKMEGIEAELESASKKVEHLEAQCVELESIRRKLKDAELALQEKHELVEQLEKTIAECQEEKDLKSTLEEELASARKQLETLETMKSELVELSVKLGEAERSAETHETALKSAQIKMVEQAKELESVYESRENLQLEHTNVETRLEEVQMELDVLRQSQKVLRSGTKRERDVEKCSECEKSNADLNKLRTRAKKSEKNTQELRRLLDDSEAARQDLEELLQDAEKENKRLTKSRKLNSNATTTQSKSASTEAKPALVTRNQNYANL